MERNDHTKILKNSEHFKNLWKTGKIGVVYSHSSGALSRDIQRCLAEAGIESVSIDSDDPRWYPLSRDNNCTHYLFLNLPESAISRPVTGRGPETQATEEYINFKECSITTAVIVVDKFPPKKKTDTLAERFLKLEKQGHTSEWLATAALVMFSLPRPSPFPDDGAFWSKEPKLVTVWKKNPDASLGFSIMTRQMGDNSVFNKVVLVKRFAEKTMEGSIGKFGHIQSINGELLDGLNIEAATQTFKNTQRTFVQLIVRFIHPVKQGESTPSPTDTRPNTLGKMEASTLPTVAASVPLPLFIFGDNQTLCKNLAYFLSGSEEELSTMIPAATPSSVCSTSCLLSLNSPRGSEEGDRILTLGSSGGEGTRSSGHILESDECVERCEVSSSYFEKQNGEMVDNRATTDSVTTRHQCMSSLCVPSDFRFVVQSLKDTTSQRPFVQLFMKSVGLYLVALDLEDVAFDPLIQYENMLYWLNLIHFYVRPSNLERVLIVGMHKPSELDQETKDKIQRCLGLFNKALENNSLVLNELYHYTGSSSQETFIYEFDQDQPHASTRVLCSHISRCLGILMERANHFEVEFFKVMFQPSLYFDVAYGKLATNPKQKLFLLDLNSFVDSSCSHLERVHLARTLSAFAPVWIDDIDNKVCVVYPRLIVELIKSFLQLDEARRVFKDEFTFRYRLPILNYPFVKKKIGEQGLTDEAEQLKLLACMKKFNLLFAISPSSEPLKQRFLVPYLATEECAELGVFQQWDSQYVGKIFGPPNCITLYAELQFPATLQFFHSVLAVLFAQLLSHQPVSHDHHYYIKLGCKQAVLPLNHENEDREVFLKYHPIQNIVEFRLPSSVRKRECWLLKAVNNCLIAAYKNILPAPADDNYHIAYCVPASPQESTGLAFAPLQTMKELSSDVKTGPDDDLVDDLVYCKHLDLQVTKNDNILTMFKNKPELKAWAGSAREAKELPVDLYDEAAKLLSSSDSWKSLGVELHILETKDINLWTHNPHRLGNGFAVMQKWKESDCTWQNLVEALDKIGHGALAKKVSKSFKE